MKNSLGLREARGRQNEGNNDVFENLSHQPFKIENTHFLRVTYLQKTPLKHKTFHRKPLVTKQSRKSLFEFCVFKFLPQPLFTGKASRELLVKMPQKKFLKKT